MDIIMAVEDTTYALIIEARDKASKVFMDVVAQAKIMQAALDNVGSGVKTRFDSMSGAASSWGDKMKTVLRATGDESDVAAKRVGGNMDFLHSKFALAGVGLTSLGGPVLATAAGGLLGLGGAAVGAGAGLGIFAMAAKPFYTSMSTASQALQQYQQAQSAGNTKAAVAALKQYQMAISQMTPAQIQATQSLNNFQNTYQNWYQSMNKPLGNLFTNVFNTLANILPKLTPVVLTVTQALQNLLGVFASWSQGSGLQSFITMIQQVSATVIPQVGSIILNLVTTIGHLFTAVMPLIHAVMDALVAGSKVLAGLNFGKLLAPLITEFTKDAPLISQLLTAIISLIFNLLKALAPVGQALAGIFAPLIRALIPIIGILGQVLAKISPVVAELAQMLVGILGKALAGLVPVLHPLVQLIGLLANALGKALMGSLSVIGPLLIGLLKPLAALLTGFVTALAPSTGAIVGLVNALTPLTFLFIPIAKALGQLSPLFAMLGRVLGTALIPIMTIVGDVISIMSRVIESNLLPTIMNLVSFLIANLMPVFTGLIPILNLVATVLGTLLVDAIHVLTPIVKVLATILAAVIPILQQIITTALLPFLKQLLGAIQILLPPLTSLLTTIGTALLGVIKAILPVLGILVGALIQILVAILPILPALVELLAALLPLLTPIIKLTGLILELVATALVYLVRYILDILTPVLKGIIDVLLYVFTHWQSIWNSVKQIASDVWTWLKNNWQLLLQLFLTIFTGGMGELIYLVVTHWNTIESFLKRIWGDIESFFTSAWSTFTSTATHLWDNVVHGITGAWSALTGAASSVWDGISSIFIGGANAVIDIINDFINGVNKLTGIIGIPAIPDISHVGGKKSGSGGSGVPAGFVVPMASGGMITAGPTYLVGEGDSAYPEAVIPTDPKYRTRAMELLNWTQKSLGGAGASAIPAMLMDVHQSSFKKGGLFGGILHSLTHNSVTNFVGGAIRSVSAMAAEAALKPLELVGEGMAKSLPSPFGKIADHLITTIFNDLIKMIAGNAGKGGVKPPSSMVPTGGQLALIAQALGLAGAATSAANEAAVNIIVSHESGWNANAINLTDSNAAAGDPSRGLMQTIMSTFMSYALPGYNTNIYDPLSNLIAGIRYAISRYGSLTNVPGVAAISRGGAYVGYDSGGMLMPGLTMAYNGTGRPERVISPQGAGGVGVTVNYNPTINVPPGTSNEMLQSMQRLIDNSYEDLVSKLVARAMPA